ncbi:MAG: hypothetical protein NTW87_05575 [Planctomycetota bacterium]|nr:hypothetical protein [Planctomycetota bacterium]
MIQKRIDQIEKADIEALVTDEVREGRTLPAWWSPRSSNCSSLSCPMFRVSEQMHGSSTPLHGSSRSTAQIQGISNARANYIVSSGK